MSLYLTIRNWVDALWAQPGQQIKLTLLPVFPLAGVGALADSIVVWIALGAITAGWTGFVVWRGWRHLKAEAIRDDRHFDRVGKFKLAKEYRGTESATAAARRRRRG